MICRAAGDSWCRTTYSRTVPNVTTRARINMCARYILLQHALILRVSPTVTKDFNSEKRTHICYPVVLGTLGAQQTTSHFFSTGKKVGETLRPGRKNSVPKCAQIEAVPVSFFSHLRMSGRDFDSHRPLHHSAKFPLIRLPLLTRRPSICAHLAGVLLPFCSQVSIGNIKTHEQTGSAWLEAEMNAPPRWARASGAWQSKLYTKSPKSFRKGGSS